MIPGASFRQFNDDDCEMIELFFKRERIPSISNQHPENCDLDPAKKDITQAARDLGSVLSKVVDIYTAKTTASIG